MCFYRYIKPWYLKTLSQELSFSQAILQEDFSFAPKLTYFLQVKVTINNGGLHAVPVKGGGSGDFVNLKDVNGFIELPADRDRFYKGEVFPYIPFRT